MGLPTTYLTSVKNVEAFFSAIQAAQAPERFTQRFLESLEFKSSSDRLLIPMLKSLRFIDDNGVPTQRYYEFLPYANTGQFFAPVAWRNTLAGVPNALLLEFWNIEKKG